MSAATAPVNRLWHASLYSRSPRYKAWLRILGTDDVPLLSPREFCTELGDLGKQYVYQLDVKALNPVQRERLIEFIATKFGAGETEIVEQLDTAGFPIRAEDVIVAFSLRAFI